MNPELAANDLPLTCTSSEGGEACRLNPLLLGRRQEAGARAKKILVIDDDRCVRHAAGLALSAAGYAVVAAEDAPSGLALAADQQPDLVLCDVYLPNGNGLEMLRELRNHPATALLPFILITGQDDGTTMRRAMVLGADDFLCKPLDDQSLLTAVEARLRRHESQEQNARKRTARELRTMSQALDQSPVSVVITGADGNIEYVNARFTQVTGYTLDEVRGKTPRVLKSGETPPAVYTELWQTITAGGEWRGELHNRRKDGTLFWERAVISGIKDDSGRLTRFLAVMEDITERKRAEADLKETHGKLIAASRQAGMAEVATGVLHNVGNVLNSVNVSATEAISILQKSKVENVIKLAGLLAAHSQDLGAFLTEDPQGKRVPGYLTQLAEHINRTHSEAITELELLRKSLDHIKQVVAMQQDYARISGAAEKVEPAGLVEDSLRMTAGTVAKHQVQVIREYQQVPPIIVEKHKALQILVNLIRNANDACVESGRPDKRLTMRVAQADGRIRISVVDNGIGIPAENQARIFEHGFTTRKDGHGFGLCSGVLAAQELGGTLTVRSDGPGHGATFTLDLPVR